MNIFFSFNEGDPIVTSVDIASINYELIIFIIAGIYVRTVRTVKR
jgi:hypothetical protein